MSEEKGMGLVEQGMKAFVENQVGPALKEVKEGVKQAKEDFKLIEDEAKKSLHEAKNLVESTISSSINEVKSQLSDGLNSQEEYINDNRSCIDNAISRIKDIEEKVLGKVSLCNIGGNRDSKTVEFELPEEARAITYEIDKKHHTANFVDGKFSGPHIVSSENVDGKHKVTLNRDLDNGSTFSIQLTEKSLAEKMDDFEKKLAKCMEGLDKIESILNKFAKSINPTS